MTAAHAHEYEVPEHSPAPVEAVEQAEGGQIVYLIDSLDAIDSGPALREKVARWKAGELETVPWDQVKRGLDL
jgi:hypothetical protein